MRSSFWLYQSYLHTMSNQVPYLEKKLLAKENGIGEQTILASSFGQF
jgi:hypothetical protein